MHQYCRSVVRVVLLIKPTLEYSYHQSYYEEQHRYPTRITRQRVVHLECEVEQQVHVQQFQYYQQQTTHQ